MSRGLGHPLSSRARSFTLSLPAIGFVRDLRGVYRDGLVFSKGEVQHDRSGEAVDVNPRRKQATDPSARSLVNRASGVAKSGPRLQHALARIKLTCGRVWPRHWLSAGHWANRPGVASPSRHRQVAATLRKRAARARDSTPCFLNGRRSWFICRLQVNRLYRCCPEKQSG